MVKRNDENQKNVPRREDRQQSPGSRQNENLNASAENNRRRDEDQTDYASVNSTGESRKDRGNRNIEREDRPV